jgi:hypothetical protein
MSARSKKGRTAPARERPLAIELLPGETWGEPLELGYDYWWASVRYNRAGACALAPAPGAPAAPSSDASATP